MERIKNKMFYEETVVDKFDRQTEIVKILKKEEWRKDCRIPCEECYRSFRSGDGYDCDLKGIATSFIQSGLIFKEELESNESN